MSDSMKFYEYIFSLRPETEDQLVDELILNNFLDYYIEYDVERNVTILKLYISYRNPDDTIVKLLTEKYGLEIMSNEVVEEKEWLKAWLDSLHPFEYIDGIWVNPFPDKPFTAPEGNVSIDLIPGTAFGTGTHPTTKLVGKYLKDIGCDGKDVLDMGCGSGILSVLAKKLNANYVLALDYDPLAVEKTQETAKINNFTFDIRESDLLAAVEDDRIFDIIAANIVAEVLVDMMRLPRFETVLKKDGYIFMSGIIEEKANMVITEAEKHSLKLLEKVANGSWVALKFQKV